MAIPQAPGVYRQDVFPKRAAALPTGVPAFLGLAASGPVAEPKRLTLASQLAAEFGPAPAAGYLAAAVAGFFANGGVECWVVRLEAPSAARTARESLAAGLAALAPLQGVDLVCAPDLPLLAPPADLQASLLLQTDVLGHCDALGDRFALLDALPGADVDRVLLQRNGLDSPNGALYYPWLRLQGVAGLVPPCGHVAGIVARSDRRVGVHKAPANEVIEGAVDLETVVGDAEQARLNPQNVNALRAFPGRGIRVWGARTLSREDAWTYVNVRRLFLTAARWMEVNLAEAAFEPNAPKLWARIGRELSTYFGGLFAAGALKGRTAAEAFYVKCDASTNPPEVREAGRVVTEIGLAPALPNEFVIVRIIHGASGASILGPSST